ncbi:MAG TPA: hypothetical protein DIS90_02070 [Cytophagales bacterium]|nr:hypothetical protein [Cytophagales bacterium]HCR55318.1 hypothetical protein [Cytophagales bacterium]
MPNESKYENDIASIRNMMDRTSKFISLSGLSGILAGLYALIGAGIVYFMVHYPRSPFQYRVETIQPFDTLINLFVVAMVVLMASIGTTLFFSIRKARKVGVKVWDSSSRTLLFNLSIPVVSGGIFILILLANGHYGVVAPACLIFYGLGLINASPNLYDEIRYLGYSEIGLGLLSAALPGYGLLFWSLGFGVLHIIYGSLMFRKYDR